VSAVRRALVLIAAATGVIALLVVPSVASKHVFEQHPEDVAFPEAFKFFSRVGIGFDTTRRRDLRMSGQGGAIQPVRCVLTTSNLRGWLCVALTSDGEHFVAAWVADEPTTRPEKLFAADDDPATRPNR